MFLFLRHLSRFFGADKDCIDEPLPKLPVAGHYAVPQSEGQWWQVEPENHYHNAPLGDQDTEFICLIENAFRTGNYHKQAIPLSFRNCMMCCLKQGEYAQLLHDVFMQAPELFIAESDELLRRLCSSGTAVAEKNVNRDNENKDDLQQQLLVYLSRQAMQTIISNAPGADTALSALLWEHTLASSIAMESLCTSFSIRLRTFPILLSLFNDLGRFSVLWTALRVTGKVPSASVSAHLNSNLLALAADHVLSDWGMPRVVRKVVAHPAGGKIYPDDRLASLKALVQVADAVAQRCGHGALDLHTSIMQLPGAQRLGITIKNADRILHDIPTRLLRAIA